MEASDLGETLVNPMLKLQTNGLTQSQASLTLVILQWLPE